MPRMISKLVWRIARWGTHFVFVAVLLYTLYQLLIYVLETGGS